MAPQKNEEESHLDEAEEGKEEEEALILFSNSRSGGGMGAKVLKKLGALLGEENVFDLGTNPHPERVLARESVVALARRPQGLRVIVCGGDGTMTWIMASVDEVKETHPDLKVLVSMMPLGTGNDLARSFGWGGKFVAGCTQPSWVRAVRRAEPATLDRWLVSVMPSAKDDTKVPEVFSVHEYDSKPVTGPTHSVISRGRHHSSAFTEASKANLESHDAEMRSSIFEADFLSVHEKKRATSSDSAGSFGDDGEEIVAHHAAPAESVLKAGATWRSYDGTFSNYFSLGVDAAGAFAFHAARRANPARFSSRLKNQLLYAWLGACATGGCCCCDTPPPRLAKVATLLYKPTADGDWLEAKLPKSARGIIVLNVQSYAGGRNLWGPPSCCRDCCARTKFQPPKPNDGLLEVVTCDSIFDLASKLVTTNGLGGRATRLLQATELRFKLTTNVYMQIDGEPWLQPQATVHIKAFGQATVLRKTKSPACSTCCVCGGSTSSPP